MTELKPFKVWLSFIIRMLLFAVALMWPAGDGYWWEAWVIVALWTVYGIVMTRYLLRHDPALLAERLKLMPISQDQEAWDKLIMLVFVIAAIGLYIVPGFDVVRYQWSEPLALWIRLLAMLLHLPCFVLLGWVMRENTYLSQVVKIDQARGHQVISSGPYARVRHPMYSAVVILLFATPAALGSRYGLLVAVAVTALLVVRIYLEERTLCRELEGYTEYTEQTRYRLIPGVW